MVTHNPKEWTLTPKGRKKLTEEQVIDIIETRYKTAHREAAAKHGVSMSLVRHIRAGRRREDIWKSLQEANDLI